MRGGGRLTILDEADVKEIKLKIAKGESRSAIAKVFGVVPAKAIGCIKRGELWADVGGEMGKQNKSEALKGITISSIEEVVDEAMSYLPASFDISIPENRMRVRSWMVRVCGMVAHNDAEYRFTRAAESAIQEAAALAINPDYYADRKKARGKRKAQRAIIQNSQKPKTIAEMAFDRLKDVGIKEVQ